MNIKKIFILGLVLAAVIAVAAFGGSGLKELLATINPAEAAVNPVSQGLSVVSIASAPAGAVVSTTNLNVEGAVAYSIQFNSAPEIPDRAPDAAGAFSSLDGSTLTLLNGPVAFSFSTTDGSAVGGMAVSSSGPEGAVELPEGAVYTATINRSGVVTVGAGVPASVMIVSGSAISGTLPALPEAGLQQVIIENGQVIAQDGDVMSGAFPALPTGEPKQVTLTAATKIYRDVTQMPANPAGGEMIVQQVVEPATLDGLTNQTMLTVWGHMEDDQFIAEVILIQAPMTMALP